MQALVFGETNLLISCVNYLLEKNWQIVAVVSHDTNIISWCRNKEIKVFSIKDIVNEQFQNYYLFSIINPHIISKAFLENNPPILAVNYHDSLLPKYAGVNSTSWAILNNEIQHGISWHEMTSNIDDGNILYQKKIAITTNDTALDLNIKCTQESLKGFIKIVDKISNNQIIKTSKQNLSKRTYYGREFVPENYGVLNFQDSDLSVNKTLNALYFGADYINPITTAKILYQNNFYIVEKESYSEGFSSSKKDRLVFKDIYGLNKIDGLSFSEEIESCKLDNKECYSLQQIKKNEFKTLNTLKYRDLGLCSAASENKFEVLEIHLDNNVYFSELCSILLLLLFKLKIVKSYIKVYNENLESKNLKLLTDNISFLDVNLIKSDITLSGLVDSVSKALDVNKIIVTKDFEYRYKLNLNSEVAIVENEGSYTELKQHKVQIYFSNNKLIKIKFSEEYTKIIKLLTPILKKQAKNILNHTNVNIQDFSLITPNNYYQNVDDWASSYNIQNQKKTLNYSISQQVKLSTNDSGVLYQNHLISYSALHEKSNKLARLLIKEYDIEIGDFIMVNLECNESFIIAILAVLKTGGIFIPINPSSSTEKIKYILEDSYTKLIISDSKNQLQKTIAESANKEVMICNIKSILTAKNLENFSSENLDTKIGSESPAFVIYSNIDNGKSSCVMISNNMLINKIELMNSEMQIYNNDKLWMCENDYFESTIWFMFWAISNGATIILSSKSLANNNLLSFFCESRATVLYLNLDALEAFDESVRVSANSKVNRIRAIYYNQESLSTNQYTNISKSFGDGVLNTLYTPTYNSIDLLNVINSDSNYYSQFSLLSESFDKNILSSNIEDAYPASHLQVGMLLASELSDTGAYHNVIVKTINTKFDATKFITIWDNIINRQELLRAKFRLDNDGWICLIETAVTKFYEIYRKSSLSKIINFEKSQDFDFNKPGLFKLIINLRRNDFDFIFSFHHAIADGNSANILMNQFISAYVFDKNLGLKTSAFYGEFVKKELESIDSLSNNKFWSDYLAETDAADKIKWNFKDTKSTDDLETLTLSLTKDDRERIHEVSKRNVIGIDNIFLYAYIKTLSQFLNQEIVTIGLNVDNNIQNEDNNFLLGLFSNIIPFQFDMKNVRNNHHGILSAFAQKVKLYKYKEFPYSKIKEIIQKDVFQFAFNYVNFESYDLGYQRSNIPFILNVYNIIDEFSINFVAHDDVIDKDYLDYFAQYYIFHLRDIINNPENNKLDLIPEDYKKIVYDWNDTDKDFPREKTIPQLFEEQVEKNPDNIAVVYESVKLTYRELNNRSNILATVLIEKYGIRIEDLVALYLDRSEHMIIAILAVLKSGGAYVPIATDYPPDRTNYILNDTNTKLVLTNEIFYDKLVSLKYSNLSDKDNTNTSYNICIVENINIKSTDMFALMNPLVGLKSNNLAYVIYTSGTTGKPNGVMVQHFNLVSTVYGIIYELINRTNRSFNIFSSTSFVFDIFCLEYCLPLLNGYTMEISKSTLIDKLIQIDKYNYIQLTPAKIEIFLSQIDCSNFNTKTHTIALLIGGERLKVSDLNYLYDFQFKKSQNIKFEIINVYGPTETTIWSTMKFIQGNEKITIGKPLPNEKSYILNTKLQPLPIGVRGDLYIGGGGLARSYLHKEELTQERFINNPFLSKKQAINEHVKLYKTGDLCEYLPDGSIEYVGRNDEQVKIRGHRIELGEIENALLSISEIKQACVIETIYDENYDEKKHLFGYYVVNTHCSNKFNFEIVQNWENIYNNEYEQYESQNLKNNFSCWNSYITGLKIPEDEMIHWRDEAIHRIKLLNPKNILEIGIGSGLLMYQLLETSNMYYGTDISKNVLKKHMSNTNNISENVKFYNIAAHEIDTIKIKDKINVVIINSVCQYFPHIKYFEEVIAKAIKVLSSEGYIFLGDVRNYDLLKNLIKNKLDYIGGFYDSNKINEIFLKENELLISPRYFEELSKKYKNLNIKILNKSDKYVNELSLYRYDVILYVTTNSNKEISLEQNGLYNLPYDNKIKPHKIYEIISLQLPNHMMPDGIIEVEALPITINGKLDKKSLPKPELIALNNYVAPRNELEGKLSFIFANILNIHAGKIGIFDNFFIIGGNSILAIKLANFVNQSFNSSIRVSDIFANKTIVAIAKLIENTRGQFKYQEYKICNADNKNLYYPFELNNVQQAYYLGRFGEFELGNTSSHIYMELKFNQLDHLKLENALNKLIERHLGLRTIFTNNQQQHLIAPDKYCIKYFLLKSRKEFLAIREELSHKIYVPEVFPLFDFIVSKYKKQYILHVSIDSLLMDGNSIQILFHELGLLYDNPERNSPILSVNFKDYMHQFTLIRQSHLFDEAKQYWIAKLDQYNFEMNLPNLCHASQIETPKFKRVSNVINKTIWNAIEHKSKSYDISLSSVILNIYGKVLSYWSNQNKLCINLTLFNRLPLHSQINEVIGDFTVLELFNYENNNSMFILESLRNIHNTLWNDIDNNLFDGIDFQRLARKELSISGNQALAPVVLTVMLGNDMMKQKNLINDSYQGVNYAITQTSQTWLDNKAYETNDGFIAEWDYVEQFFDEDIIIAMHNHYCYLIESLAELDWETSIFPSLKLPSRDLEIVNHANSYTQETPKETLFSYYEKFVITNKLLNRVAIIDNSTISSTEYNYKKLISDSNLLAKYLCVNNSGTDQLLIAVLSDKGYNQVVSCLAIMKSGNAYLPLNVEWPLGRIEDVLIQGQVQDVLISREQYKSEELIEKLGNKFTLLIIEDILNQCIQDQTQNTILPNVKTIDIAYVIFTSGSTGVPKGVTISHKGALNTILAVNKKYNINKKDKVLALSELSFDLSVYDIFGMLFVGGTVVFPRQNDTKDPKHWNDLICKHEITIWNTVPQLASLFLDNVQQLKLTDNKIRCQSIRLFLLSGDWIPPSLPNAIKIYFKNSIIVSLGGATEGSIWSIWYDITDTRIDTEKIPYGIAMPNQKMYILNSLGEHCPIGVSGEIYIGGDGIALNYWNDKEKTIESFVQHQNLGVVYKTGDIGKWHKSGYIEFLGRQDNQVKLNGYRIELQEISSSLKEIEGINNSIVAIKDNNLIAYIVLENLTSKAAHKYINEDKILDNASSNKFNQSSEEFKLSQHGVRNDLEILYIFNDLNLNESSYRSRKSYRKFIEPTINLSKDEIGHLIKSRLNPPLSSSTERFNQADRKILEAEQILKHMLSQLSAIKLSDKILPKYLYPSAGSTYAVQCYVELKISKNKYVYYYNPIKHVLTGIKNERNLHVNINNVDQYKLVFKLYKPGIEPLYGNMSAKLSWLEMGHILYLLEEKAKQLNVRVKLIIVDKPDYIDENYYNLIELVIDINGDYLNNNRILLDHDLDINMLFEYLQKKQNTYINIESKKTKLDFYTYGLKEKLSALGQMLSSGSALICFNGSEKPNELLMSGYYAQLLTEELYKKDIGCCSLGLVPYAGINYSLIIGNINQDLKACAEINLEDIILDKYLRANLETKLPQYMIPNYYMQIDEIPLTINGKIDINALPKFDISLQNEYFAPRNILESKLCILFTEVLNQQDFKIGINHDFFKIGGNSLLAIKLLSKLNNEYKITLNDIFKFKTPEKIAVNIIPIKIVSFTDKLNYIKHIESKLSYKPRKQPKNLIEKNTKYQNDVKNLIIDKTLKNIKNILLTGSTGYLGCHILYQLLFDSNYKIYLLIRAESNEDAYCRLYNKFKYYFDLELKDFSHRIEIIASDIEHEKLGLNNEQYKNLIRHIDSIIHAAARVKHYGDYDVFYKANVEATVNLLEFTKLTNLKDFHYISTIVVHLDTCIPDYRYINFNETDEIIGIKQNIYVKTKYEAELAVVRYRTVGINTNIYRLGNLAMNSQNSKIQENFEENFFFIKMKTILKLGILPKEIANVEISPVDYTASAIVKLFDKNVSKNCTYHLTNPYLCDLGKLFKQSVNVNVKIATLEDFVFKIMYGLDNSEQSNLFKLFMLHQNWSGNIDVGKITSVEVFQERTIKVLSALGFRWIPIYENMFIEIINKSFS